MCIPAYPPDEDFPAEREKEREKKNRRLLERDKSKGIGREKIKMASTITHPGSTGTVGSIAAILIA